MQDLRCQIPNHNKKKFVSVLLSDQAEQRLYCFQCQSDDKVKVGQLCDLDEVMEGNPYTVYNWPYDQLGKEIKDTLMQYKTPEQQKKEVEDFFTQMRQKLIESVDNIRTIIVEALTATQFFKDEKLQQEKKEDKKDDKKDTKKDDKKDTKKDDKKDTKKDDKKDDKKDTKKDDKKDTKKEDIKDQKEPEKVDLTPSVENLKRYYEQVYDLSKIKTIIKENAKGDPRILSDKLSELLNDQRRKDMHINMKSVFENFKKNTNQQSGIQTSQQQLQVYYDQIDEKVKNWASYFGKIKWHWTVSKADDSAKIKRITEGIEYSGSGVRDQIIYSSEAFSQGQHGCIVLITDFDTKRQAANGNLIVGLVSEEKKDLGPYAQDFRKCLFTGIGSGMEARIGGDFSNVFKVAPKLLAIKLDVDNDYFEVSDGKRTVVYGLERTVKLKEKKDQKWRIYIDWRASQDKLRLAHSY